MQEKDMLKELWSKQEELNLRIGVDTSALTEQGQVDWILKYSRALTQETAELIDSVPWKWWAKYQEFDRQNAKIEIVDLFHFLISLAQVMGMSAEDVFELYTKKHKVNHDRQESGYTKKDENDNRRLQV